MTEIDLEALSTDTHGYTVDDNDDDDPILVPKRRCSYSSELTVSASCGWLAAVGR
jgi:hypothetical protein